ncbi:MAG: carboxypeptidase regulatory-like domain-containing protein [Bacteroidales bacterium]|nr:carboxypeptidase regulatory-like domain-containing protein [Bacteroidales bacterium]
MKSNSVLSMICCALCALLVTFILFSCNGGAEPAPKEPEYADVQGVVTNQVGVTVEGATVTMGTKGSVTDAQGRFKISGLRPGKIQAKIEAEGCDLFTQDVMLKAGADNAFDFTIFSYASVLKVDRTELVIPSESSDYEFKVAYNSDWTVESDADWIRPDKSSGKGGGPVVFHADASFEGEERYATLTFKSAREKIEIPVTQDFPLVVVSATIKIGNEMDEIMDEIIVKLNKPVQKIYGVQALNPETCPYIEGMVAPDEVKLTGLFNLTEDISFLFEAKNNFGFVEDVVVNTQLYKKKIVPDLPPEEGLVDIMLFNEGKELLAWSYRLLQDDYHLQRIDIESGKAVKDFFFPVRLPFCHSPYDGKWYTWNEDKMYTIDFETGNLTTVYTFESDEYYGCTYPFNIGILSDGTGLASMYSNLSSAESWRFVDTRGGTITTREPSPSEKNSLGVPYSFIIATSFDASKLYLGSESQFFIYDPQNPVQFRAHEVPYYGSCWAIFPHARKDLVYVRSSGDCYPMDSEWHITLPVSGDVETGGMGFCYDSGMEDIVYLKNGYQELRLARFNLEDGGQDIVATHPMERALDFQTDPAGGYAYCYVSVYDQKEEAYHNAICQFETSFLNAMIR